MAGVSCGGGHSGLVYSDGSAYTFGRGEQGQLGHGVTLSEATPRKVTELQGVRLKGLSCGAQHTLFLSAQVARALALALTLTLTLTRRTYDVAIVRVEQLSPFP